MREGRAHSAGEIIDTTRQTGKLRLYACAAQVKFLGLSAEDLEGVVDEVISLPNFLGLTSGAETKLQIALEDLRRRGSGELADHEERRETEHGGAKDPVQKRCEIRVGDPM